MQKFDVNSLKAELPLFREKCSDFHAGKIDKNVYKGFSGFYGSVAQRGGKSFMLRLRMTAGRVTKEKFAFVADMIRAYDVKKAHFTTCQTIQLHDLGVDATCEIMEKAFDAGIVTIGGGGDYPRNVMCSPLSGIETGEYFDVIPYAQAAADYMIAFVKAEKMPRKLKVAFSNSPTNATHATYRDLGFVARPDGLFDIYSAGGLGNNPKFGVKVAEAIDPKDILYYIKAMWITFRAHGNYENRGKARTRYMVEAVGGEEAYRTIFTENLKKVFESGEDLKINVAPTEITKVGNGTTIMGNGIIPQKQEGLYTVVYHPIGGQPNIDLLCRLSDKVNEIDQAEARISPEEAMYIINLNGDEAKEILEMIHEDTAQNLFESSVACIGADICQVGLRDSQALIRACVDAVRQAEIPDGALPQIHISGCPSSCGTHQTGRIGFRGASKRVDGASQAAFVLYIGGVSTQGKEEMGREVATICQDNIPAFLVELGRTIANDQLDFETWYSKNPNAIDAIAQKYL